MHFCGFSQHYIALLSLLYFISFHLSTWGVITVWNRYSWKFLWFSNITRTAIYTFFCMYLLFKHVLEHMTWNLVGKVRGIYTVVSCKYAPPFATLPLVENAGGAYSGMRRFLSQTVDRNPKAPGYLLNLLYCDLWPLRVLLYICCHVVQYHIKYVQKGG